MKLKRLAAAFMALSLCAALTACGDNADSSSKREEESSVANNKAEDDKPGQADSSKDEASAPNAENTAAATEATTTAVETTTQPQAVEFTPLIEAGGEITAEVLEQFVPSVFGLSITEAMDAFITSLNITTYSTNIQEGLPSSSAPADYPARWVGDINLREAPLSMQGMDLVCISVNTYMASDDGRFPNWETATKQYTAEIAFAFTKEDADTEAYDEARAAVYTVFKEATGIGSLAAFNNTDATPCTYSIFLSKYPKKAEE